jgi:hypothetical protein
MPTRPFSYPRGGGGRAGRGEWCRSHTGVSRLLDPTVRGGVVLGQMRPATLAPR